MNEDDAKQLGRRTFRRRYLIFLTMVLAGLGAVSVIIHRNSVEHRLAALRAAGYPTSLAEFVEDNGGQERDDVKSAEPSSWCLIVTR